MSDRASLSYYMHTINTLDWRVTISSQVISRSWSPARLRPKPESGSVASEASFETTMSSSGSDADTAIFGSGGSIAAPAGEVVEDSAHGSGQTITSNVDHDGGNSPDSVSQRERRTRLAGRQVGPLDLMKPSLLLIPTEGEMKDSGETLRMLPKTKSMRWSNN